MTAQDLITSSLRLIGVLASGESLGANEATDGLSSLNDMLDSWSTNNLLIPNKVREVFALTSSQQTYTMGQSGSPSFSTARPIHIEDVYVQVGSGSNVIERPVQILTMQEFADIKLKTLQSTFPIYCYPEGTYPNETLNFWPIPSAADNIVIYSAKPLANLSSLTTAISLPPGYQRALRYALALELAPEYGRPVSEDVAAHASAAIADIKRINYRPRYLKVDDAINPSARTWDWRIGDSL